MSITTIPVSNLGAMLLAIHGLPHSPDWTALPDWARVKLQEAQEQIAAPIKIAWTVEALYAARPELSDDQRVVAVQAATFAAAHGFGGLGDGGRGIYIAQRLRKDAGETVSSHRVANDPEPLAYRPAPSSDDEEVATVEG